jgi:DNA-binding MarR family transcriptional regulator
MNWLDARPEAIVDQADPSELLGSLRQAKSLTPERAVALDHVLRQWTLRALARSGDPEGLLQLDELAYLASERLDGQADNTAEFRNRWRAFRDLLESKRLAIAGAQAGRASRLLHADKVLELLNSGPMAQSALRKTLGVTAARVSQILAVMEESGLIRREKKGRENLVARASLDVQGAPAASSHRRLLTLLAR